MKAPSYQPPPLDPLVSQEEQQAQQEQINALQLRTQGDSASLMARYGALAGLAPAAPAGTK